MGVEVTGTLHEDGTLTLDAKPPLPPGRVRVLVRAESLAEFVERCRTELEATGFQFLDEAAMAQRIAEMRGDDEDRVERAYEEMERWQREQEAR